MKDSYVLILSFSQKKIPHALPLNFAKLILFGLQCVMLRVNLVDVKERNELIDSMFVYI
jgi:hypothetical protein